MSTNATATALALRELTSFLSPAARTDVRAKAAETALQMTGMPPDELAPPRVREALDAELIPARRRLVGDVPDVSRPARAALTNLSATGLLLPNSKCMDGKKEFFRWLVDDVRDSRGSGALLVNLTSYPGGPERVHEHYLGGAGRAVATLLEAASDAARMDLGTREECFAAVRNLTTIVDAQSAVIESDACLELLLRIAATGETAEMRRDASGALRHTLVTKDVGRIARVLSRDGAGWLTAALVLGVGPGLFSFPELNDTIDDERLEREGASDVLLRVYRGQFRFARDPHRDARDLVVDCLACLCSSPAGRERMRAVKIYPALRGYHPHESDEAVSDKVHGVVDILLADEEDLMRDSTAVVPAAATTTAPATVASGVGGVSGARAGTGGDAAWEVD